jgi:hypothetical protein
MPATDGSADVTLLIDATNQDIEQMATYNKAMITELEDLVKNVGAILNDPNMKGNWTAAWEATQRTVNTAIDKMNSDFGNGVRALENMVDQQLRSDGQAAGRLSLS